MKEEKERKKDKAFTLWLACHTQEEIAGSVEVDQKTITNWLEDFRKISEVDNFLNSPDFTTPIYNVWRRKSKSNTVDHFGNSEIRFVDNLLYLYTQPFDVVIDPFGCGAFLSGCVAWRFFPSFPVITVGGSTVSNDTVEIIR